MFKTRKRDSSNFKTPQQMYDDYRNRRIKGIHNYQSYMIDLYMKDGYDKRDVALELPTGTGKTLIGLLIGEYRRRKNKEKVVYVCPTNQLVYQTAEYANQEYGIKVIPFTGARSDYDAGDKFKYTSVQGIAVTNYSSLFNINSFFKDADIIIFDDAHSGENYIANNWTVTLDRRKEEELYFSLVEELKGCICEEQYNILLKQEPDKDDLSWCDKVHNAKLYNKFISIKNTLDRMIDTSKQKYSWSNIKNNLHACNIYLSWKEIIIRPYIVPTLTHEVFNNAKQRIYMSATLGVSGELERAYGIESIYRLPMVKEWKDKGIGRKFFMFPYASFKEDETGEILKKIVKTVDRGLIIVNDFETQDTVVEFLDKNTIANTFIGKDIEKSKQEFISTKNAFAVVASRFDGIDFPEDECRMLILCDLPTATHIQEKFMMTKMCARVLFEERIRTRLIQALGRCTRSQTDYAAICVLGEELMNSLLAPKNLEKFHPELQAELSFGEENSEGYNSIEDYFKLLEVFLNDRDKWEAEAEDGILVIRDEIIEKRTNIENEAFKQLMKTAKYEVKLQYNLWKKDYLAVLDNVDNILRELQHPDLKGYRGYWNYIGGCSAYYLYQTGEKMYLRIYKEYLKKASQSTIAVNWFTQIEENSEEKEDTLGLMRYVIDRIESILIKEGGRGINQFYTLLDSCIELLKSKDGNEFEKGHMQLGKLAGYKVTNPKGDAEPDPIWIINDRLCIVAEDKIYKLGKSIPANDVKQAAGHEIWIRSKIKELGLQEDVTVISVFITTSTQIASNAAIYGKNICYLNRDNLVEWAEKIVIALKEAKRTFSGEGSTVWREMIIQYFMEHKLTPQDYVEIITEKKLRDIVSE